VRLRIQVPQPKSLHRNSPNLLFSLVLAAGLTGLAVGQFGCGNPAGPVPCKGSECDPPPPPPFPERTNPINAVEYLRHAWADRDSVHADSVLAPDYQGTSTELGSNPTTLSFVRSDEIRALYNLKDDPDVKRLTMDFGPSTSWVVPEPYPGDPPDWVVVRVNTPNITLETIANTFVVSSSNTTFEFKAKPVTTGSQTLWEVVRWLEVHNAP
jgi:hypothetical protein